MSVLRRLFDKPKPKLKPQKSSSPPKSKPGSIFRRYAVHAKSYLGIDRMDDSMTEDSGKYAVAIPTDMRRKYIEAFDAIVGDKFIRRVGTTNPGDPEIVGHIEFVSRDAELGLHYLLYFSPSEASILINETSDRLFTYKVKSEPQRIKFSVFYKGEEEGLVYVERDAVLPETAGPELTAKYHELSAILIR